MTTVSERARELLALECEANGGEMSAAALRHGEEPDFFVPSCCALRAIEAALSSPVGEGVREGVIEEVVPCEGSVIHSDQAIYNQGWCSRAGRYCRQFQVQACVRSLASTPTDEASK